MKAFVSVLLAVGCLLCLARRWRSPTPSTAPATRRQRRPERCLRNCDADECTLRAAIQESNASTLVVDEIHFAGAFNGQLADTITLGSQLPPIANPVRSTQACARPRRARVVRVPDRSLGLELRPQRRRHQHGGNRGLAITGATTGIRVVNSSKSFVATQQLARREARRQQRLRHQHRHLARSGLGRGDDRRRHGGADATSSAATPPGPRHRRGQRRGRSTATTSASGRRRDAGGQRQDIEITDLTAAAASRPTNNEVGDDDRRRGATRACDGGCNVISGSRATAST